MRIRIVRFGSMDTVEPVGPEDSVSALRSWCDQRFSFRQKGAEYSEAYQTGRWDGRIRLVSRRGSRLAVPAGLTEEIREYCVGEGWDVAIDDRRPPDWSLGSLEWIGHPLRGYQKEAVADALRAGGGILSLPVRAGKTLIAARLIHETDSRTLFVVTSKALMHQAAEEFRACLADVSVGCFGDDVDERQADVVVATIQTIVARGVEETLSGMRGPSWPQVPTVLERGRWTSESPVTNLIVDEVHHTGSVGKAWREALLAIPARRRWGLSATVKVDRRGASESSDVWLLGICGPVVHALTATDLIRMGHLLSPTVRFVYHGAPEIGTSAWSAGVYTKAVVECEERNATIVRETLERVARGKTVLVDVSRRAHGRELFRRLREALGPAKVLLALGGCTDETRKRMLDLGPDTELRVVVGTILGEGVNIPGLDVVVNAEAGRGRDATTGKNVPAFDQRLRCLTKVLGKKDAEVVELIDDHERHLRGWTLSRLEGYESHPGFRIVVPHVED